EFHCTGENNIAIGGVGNDKFFVNSSDSKNTFIYNLGDGHDEISAFLGNNTIVFNGISSEDITATCLANGEIRILFKNDENSSLTIKSDVYNKVAPWWIENFVFSDRTLSKEDFIETYLADQILGENEN